TQDGCTAERYDYGTCDDNTAVVFYKIINGGHTWPGSGLPFAGINTNQDFKATEVIWKFFEPSYEPVGVLSIANDFDFSLYPNPTSTSLVVDLPNNIDFQKAEFYSLTGQFIFATQNQTIDISKIDKGIYICKIYSSKGIATQKITKL
ncbi:MAG: T9SS type A sorting domain-containing protein, partial [Chitinophagales bacterium]